ncbi:MAG: ABC transporter ATP-binding protein [Clostridia bacterium]|nr:ABC transporter ATP-binding protein [Clostridia bacterium]
MALIEVEHLTKTYGSHVVLDDISFAFEGGQIIGLLGPNGSGKTSLIKILVGLITDYSGGAYIDGHSADPHTKAMVAYLPEKTYLADWMRGVDAIQYFADFFADFDQEKALRMLEQFQLPPKQLIKSMSKGMQEKLQLLLVMCRNAKLYILDEPLGGVDPAARAFILDTIMKNHPAGSTIMLSTHLIYDVQHIFDSVLMIGRGKVLVKASVDELCSDGRTIEDIFKEVYHYAWQVN